MTWGPESIIDRGAWGRMAQLPDGQWLSVITRFWKTEPSRLCFYRATISDGLVKIKTARIIP